MAELLAKAQTRLDRLRAIVVVHGPGSFTGVRVGLSAVKGLAEPAGIPVVAVSRLAVLAHKAGTQSAALDAHRHEVFLRIAGEGIKTREILAGAAELAGMVERPDTIATCDERRLGCWAGCGPVCRSRAWSRRPRPTRSNGRGRRSRRKTLRTSRCSTGIICGARMPRFLAKLQRRRGAHERRRRVDAGPSNGGGRSGPGAGDCGSLASGSAVAACGV